MVCHKETEGRKGRLPLFEIHDRGAFVLEDGLVGVDADVKLVAELAGLYHGAGMTCGG